LQVSGKRKQSRIIFENGKFVEARITDVTGKEPLDTQNIKKFKRLVEVYRDDIVRKWVDFFVYNKPIELERITKIILNNGCSN
jgi:hypothetical protein